MAHPRLRASARDLRASPKRSSKSNIEEELKKLIDLDSPTPESQKNFNVCNTEFYHAFSMEEGISRSISNYLVEKSTAPISFLADL